MATQSAYALPLSRDLLAQRYRKIRTRTIGLCASLELEDMVVQSMPDVSPTKWHLAHSTWFFEQFLLSPLTPEYRVFHQRYNKLFNSYYQTLGAMHPRAERGLLSRPTVREILDYRAYVDRHMSAFIDNADIDEIEYLVELGLNHEQQHQELLLTDIKHVLSANPLKPAFRGPDGTGDEGVAPELEFIGHEGGLHNIGATGNEFCFDNETPNHQVLLKEFSIANRLVTNAEYLRFIDAGGYQTPGLWLSDGWAWVEQTQAERPLNWSADVGTEFTLVGSRPIEADAPVCHVSYYEADAYACWAGARLPTEAEWEVAASQAPVTGNMLDDGKFRPVAMKASRDDLHQMFGDVWEWTASAYSGYPGFKPLRGSLGEYNGKFMCNQMVVRGGSCVTPSDHIRASYRNFFYPHQRWQFLGIRLAND